MPTPFVYNSPVSITHCLMQLYLDEMPELTFGAWVMARVFPNATQETLYTTREFVAAARPSDARYYLIGFLRQEVLSQEEAIRYLDETVRAVA